MVFPALKRWAILTMSLRDKKEPAHHRISERHWGYSSASLASLRYKRSHRNCLQAMKPQRRDEPREARGGFRISDFLHGLCLKVVPLIPATVLAPETLGPPTTAGP
jgi:hypothetical protein